MTSPAHCGVSATDPRNQDVIAYFKPKTVTPEYARALLAQARPGTSAEAIEERVREVMKGIIEGPIKEPSPLSQSLGEADDPATASASIRTSLKACGNWMLHCRGVAVEFFGAVPLWSIQTRASPLPLATGRLALSCGCRPRFLLSATADQAMIVVRRNPGKTFDIGPAGPRMAFRQASAEA